MTMNMNALIIDDDEDSIFILQSLLAKTDMKIDAIMVSHDTQVHVSDISPPDVIFLDLNMPVMTGYDLLAQFHESDTFQGVPIVAYSMYTDQVNDAYQAGFHSFISKPLNRHTFSHTLMAILDGKHVWDVS